MQRKLLEPMNRGDGDRCLAGSLSDKTDIKVKGKWNDLNLCLGV
ncbi:MAG TPA: hypothetical protein V6D10_02005 [Trichocoleus sp.]